MKLESGNGKSRLSQTKNNLFGLNATTGSENKKAFSFATKGDSVRKFGQLISKNYVGKGLTTIEKVAKKYCPANGRWSGHVKSIMKSDFRKLARTMNDKPETKSTRRLSASDTSSNHGGPNTDFKSEYRLVSGNAAISRR